MPGPAKTVTLKLYADSAEAQRKLDDIYAKAEELKRLNPTIAPKVDKAAATAGLAVLRKELKDTQSQADKLSGSSGKLSKSVDQLGTSAASAGSGLGSMGGPMAAAIGAGVALSPVLVTLGVGLAGFGAAAIGVIRPIENAAKKTGGLSANMKLLNPEQQKVARGLLGLGQEYGKFQKSMQPEVFKVFNSGLHLAGNLMHDVQPVAKATGTALGGLLDRVDQEFQSGTWQSFFGWMGRQAGPDLKLLGDGFIHLMDTIPPLMRDLNPLAVGILHVVDEAAQAADKVSILAANVEHLGSVVLSFGHHNSGSSGPFAWLDNQHLIHGIKFVNDILPRAFQHAAEGAAGTKLPMDGFFQSTRKAGSAVYTTGKNAYVAAAHLQTMAAAVTALNTAESTSLNNQLAYTNALLASKQGAIDLRTALAKSHDEIGLHTAAQRNSFGVANTYISDLLQVATNSWKSGHGTDGAAAAIRNALPLLEQAKTKNRDYWKEIATLVGWLHKYELMHQIHDVVKLSGSGAWTFGLSGTGSFPSRPIKGHGAAAGWRVPGSGSGDTVPAMLTPGEAVVPRHLVPAVAPFLRANKVPGFASGGLVPSYAGPAGGLKPWGQHNFDATLTAMTQAFVQAGKQQQALGGIGGIAGNVRSYTGDVLRVLSMLGQSSSALGIVLSQMTTESGGNPLIVNKSDSNWMAGHPSVGLMQVIAGTFAQYAGPFRNTGPFEYGVSVNPMANIFAGLNYATHRYGAGWTSVLGHGHGYDHGGYLPQGLSLAYNGTGHPEPVGPAAAPVNITVNVQTAVGQNPAEVGRQIAEKILHYTKIGGHLYPNGATPK